MGIQLSLTHLGETPVIHVRIDLGQFLRVVRMQGEVLNHLALQYTELLDMELNQFLALFGSIVPDALSQG